MTDALHRLRAAVAYYGGLDGEYWLISQVLAAPCRVDVLSLWRKWNRLQTARGIYRN